MSQGTTQQAGPPDAATGRTAHPWWTLVALAIGAATAIVSQTLVLPVLPDIANAFDVTATDAIWVLTVNLMAATVFSPLLGRMGDAFGRKRVLVAALVAVAAGSLLCAVAGEFWLLLVGRVLQGTAFGIIALAISIVRDSFPPERVSLGIALLSAIMGIGGGGGLVLAGLLAELGSFELIFWTSLVLAAAGVVLISVTARESPRSSERHIDVLGTVLLAGWLTSLLLAVDRGADWGWADPVILSMFGGAAVLLGVWVVVELRVRVPLVDMAVFRKPVVLGTNITGMFIGLGMFGAFALINQFVQTPERVGYGFSADALETGLTLLPMTGGTLIAAPLASLLVERIGPKFPMATGSVLAAGSFAALAAWNSQQWHFLAALSVIGIGVGLAMAAMPAALNLGVPRSQTGIANGMNATLRELGSSTGSAFAGAILASEVIAGTPIPTLGTFELAFVLAAGVCVIAAVSALLIPQRQTSTEQPETAEPTDEPVAGEWEAGHDAPPAAPAPQVSATTGDWPNELAVFGTISSAGGMPAPQARVTLTDAYGGQYGRARTDEQGRYSLAVSTGGTYVVTAVAPGVEPHAGLVAVADRPARHDVELAASANLGGTIYSGQPRTGDAGAAPPANPAVDATVTLIDTQGAVAASCRTDRTGRYQLSGLIEGNYTLIATDEVSEPTADTVTLVANQDSEHDIYLPMRAALHGVIRTSGGAPIGQAMATLTDAQGAVTASAVTEHDGAFVLRDLPAGSYTLTATAYLPDARTVALSAGETTTIDVGLQSAKQLMYEQPDGDQPNAGRTEHPDAADDRPRIGNGHYREPGSTNGYAPRHLDTAQEHG